MSYSYSVCVCCCPNSSQARPEPAPALALGRGSPAATLAQASEASETSLAPWSQKRRTRHRKTRAKKGITVQVILRQGSLKKIPILQPWETCCFFNTKIKLEAAIYKLQCSGVSTLRIPVRLLVWSEPCGVDSFHEKEKKKRQGAQRPPVSVLSVWGNTTHRHIPKCRYFQGTLSWWFGLVGWIWILTPALCRG